MINLDYRYLRAFYLTAKFLNFSKAATELSIAQSAVSRQIKLLEESFGEQLIIRSSKKVLLTDKGKSLFLAIQRFEEMAGEINQNTGPGIIRVGILHGLLENWFIDVIKKYISGTDHQLHIVIESPAQLKQYLIDGKVDIIFTTENIQSDLITSLRLFEEKLTIISKKEVDVKKLEQYTWIVYNDSDFLFDVNKKHSKQIVYVSSITSIIKLVKEGVGVAIVPEHTLKDKDKLFRSEVKGIKRPQIHLSTLNFQSMPRYLDELISIVKTLNS